MYQVGDKVVHPGHGGCVVDEVAQRSQNGDLNDFYTLLPLNEESLRLMVPVKTAQALGLRMVISKREADELLEAIQGMDISWVADRRERQQTFDEILRSDDLMEIARTIKALLLQKATAKLTASDEQLLHKGKDKLYSELALSVGASYLDIERLVARLTSLAPAEG